MLADTPQSVTSSRHGSKAGHFTLGRTAEWRPSEILAGHITPALISVETAILAPHSVRMLRGSAGSESRALALPAASLNAAFSLPASLPQGASEKRPTGALSGSQSEHFRRSAGPAVILFPEGALRASLRCHNQHHKPGTVLAHGTARPSAELDLGVASREDAGRTLAQETRGPSCHHRPTATTRRTSRRARRISRR
jgi:hypothetical protein